MVQRYAPVCPVGLETTRIHQSRDSWEELGETSEPRAATSHNRRQKLGGSEARRARRAGRVAVPAVPLPAPVALARLVDSLTSPGAKAYVYQPKWDGYRALYSAGRLYSRNGTNLTPLFPDLIPTLAGRLTRDLTSDGEWVTWSVIAWTPYGWPLGKGHGRRYGRDP